MLALPAEVAEFPDRGGPIRQQAFPVRRVHPGPHDDLGAVPGADAVLVGVDDLVQRRRVHHPLLDEDGLQRPHPEGDIRRHVLMVVIVVVAVIMAAVVAVVVRLRLLGHQLPRGRERGGPNRRILDESAPVYRPPFRFVHTHPLLHPW